jgi:hypothetical protein
MNTTTIQALPAAAHCEPKFPFDLVVAYEDTATRNRAVQLYDHLAQQLLDDYDFQVSWWKLDHLESPRLYEQAATAAAEANMVIISLRGDQHLPAVFNQWLQSWISRKDSQKSALVVLLGATGQTVTDARQLHAHLQQAARQAKMDFFAHAYELAEPDLPYTTASLNRRAEAVTPLLDEILQQPTSIPRWGINE